MIQVLDPCETWISQSYNLPVLISLYCNSVAHQDSASWWREVRLTFLCLFSSRLAKSVESSLAAKSTMRVLFATWHDASYKLRMYACMFQNMGDFYKSGDHSRENGYMFWYFLARPRRMSQQQLIYNAMPAESKLSSAHVYTIPVSCRLCKCVMSCSFIQNKGFSWYLRTRTTPRDWMTAERTSDLNSNFHAPPF